MKSRFITMSDVSEDKLVTGEFNFNGIKINNKIACYERPKIVVGETTLLPACFDTMPKTHWQYFDFYSQTTPHAYTEKPFWNGYGAITGDYIVSDCVVGSSRIKKMIYYNNGNNIDLTGKTVRIFQKIDDNLLIRMLDLIDIDYYINSQVSDAVVFYDSEKLSDLPTSERGYEDSFNVQPSLYSLQESREITWLQTSKFFRLLNGIDVLEEL